jgi:flagellar biosynthesis chaperone FliJ
MYKTLTVPKLDKTQGQKKYEELFAFIEVLEELIQGDRTNRTQIHEALWNYRNRVPSVEQYIRTLEDTISHHRPDLFTHCRFIAMHLTFSAYRILTSKLAIFQSF